MGLKERKCPMGNKRQANIRKREKIKFAKEKRDLQKEILRTIDVPTPRKLRLAMQLKLTRLLSIYKSKYGEMKK